MGRVADPGVIALSLGSNLGDRRGHLQFALARLAGHVLDLRASDLVETDPVDAPGPAFLNQAVVGRTLLSARGLLDRLLEIEAERGRVRPFPGAPRPLDLDLVLFGEAILDEAGLVVPHPRFRQRRFVLAPLAQVAPDLRDPVTGRTVGELLRALA